MSLWCHSAPNLDFQINVYNISSISLIISLLGFGSAIKRWLSTGRISDLTTELSCGSSGYIEQVIESVKNQFWKDVLYAWKSVIEKDENKDWTNFLANTVWLILLL
jgi:hypothetical protein